VLPVKNKIFDFKKINFIRSFVIQEFLCVIIRVIVIHIRAVAQSAAHRRKWGLSDNYSANGSDFYFHKQKGPLALFFD